MMTSTSHQTVRLSRGKHVSPAEGACVMELASMLGGEPFSDHPLSVCPVIGAFLRTYNDSVDDRRRQDLYAYASRVVGSRASYHVERTRQAHLEQWTKEIRRQRHKRLRLPRWLGLLCAGAATDIQAAVAVYEVTRGGSRGHARALALIDELLAIGGGERTPNLQDEQAMSLPAAPQNGLSGTRQDPAPAYPAAVGASGCRPPHGW
jgi:hypothetical protein